MYVLQVLRPYMSPVVHDIVQTSYRTLTLPYTPRLEYTHDIISTSLSFVYPSPPFPWTLPLDGSLLSHPLYPRNSSLYPVL